MSTSLWVPFAERMTHRIVSGEYEQGALIPTESQLSEEFGVSRSVIREGIKILSGKGLIRINRGTGTEVLDRSQWRSFDADILTARLEYGDRAAMLREVLILRKAIEPELAAAVAEQSSEEFLAPLDVIVGKLIEAQHEADLYLMIDAEFHDCIAELSGISLGREVMRSLEGPLQVQRNLTSRIPGNPGAAHEQHLEIYRHIVDRDADAARSSMRAHIHWAEARLHATLDQAIS